MIIKYPTGFYDLPEEPSDSGNITFTVSNELPPRTNLLFPKIPPGVVDRQRAVDTSTVVERRVSVGEMIFSVSRASRIEEGNASKQYETGAVLEFNEATTKAVVPMVVSEKTETQHDLNKFDYVSMGLTVKDQLIIESSSLQTHAELSDRLNLLKQQRADAEVQINTQQKTINEITRNISALNVIIENSSETASDVVAVVEKLESRHTEAQEALNQAISDANQYADDAAQAVNELRTVAVVVK